MNIPKETKPFKDCRLAEASEQEPKELKECEIPDTTGLRVSSYSVLSIFLSST